MGSPLTVVPSLHAAETFMCLQPVLPHIQLLWELVLTNEVSLLRNTRKNFLESESVHV